MILNPSTPTANMGRSDAMTYNGSLPARFARALDEAMAEFSDRERMLFLQGVSLAMRFAATTMTDLSLNLKNCVPDLLSGPVTVRRIGL